MKNGVRANLAIVSHDAGGAEILSSHVLHENLECVYVLGGPALKIFRRKLGTIECLSLQSALNSVDTILCGTSWQSDLEWKAISLAKQAGKKSIAFLDHWVNFKERFVRGGEAHLPDELWVGDKCAYAMAIAAFPNRPVQLVSNPYFRDIKRELSRVKNTSRRANQALRVLYVCEPIREHALREFGDERYWGYTEEDALRYFLGSVRFLDAKVEKIVVRPHPSEALEKYYWARDEYHLPIIFGGKASLLEEIADCDVVVGCESMAMVIGLLAKRRVISCVPPGGKPCALPQPEIQYLSDFARGK